MYYFLYINRLLELEDCAVFSIHSDGVKMNHLAKYVDQKACSSKVIIQGPDYKIFYDKLRKNLG